MKKRILLSLLAVVCITVLFLILPVCAAETSGSCGENLTWKLEGTVLTISGTGDMYGYDKDNMPPWWEDYQDVVTKVVIEEGVTSLSHKSFIHFGELTEVEMAGSVKTIGGQAFKDCAKLTSISLPGVEKIGDFAFDYCSSLKNVEFSDKLSVIDMYAFRYCTALESVTIPASVEDIYLYAFAECSSLKKVWFTGDCPQWIDMIFTNVTATAYYPCGNTTWTTEKMQTTQGNITWKAYAAAGSVHTEVTDAAKTATCTADGSTEGKHCSACGEVIVAQQKIAAVGHSYGDWKEVKAPTTTATGLAERTCANCGNVEQKTLAKLESQSPAPTQPKETEPAQTEPAATKPAQTEPVSTKPIQTEPAQTEPAETEPVQTDATEAVTEPTQTEPVQTDTAATEPADTAVTTEATEEPATTQAAEEEVKAEKSSAPWGGIAAAVVVILGGGAAAAVFIIKKRGK